MSLIKPRAKGQRVNLNPVQYKWLTVKDANVDKATRKVSGYLAVFGVKDSDEDVLLKGCFAKSLTDRGPGSTTNRKIAFLWQHDMRDPIGKFTVLKEDDYGLYFEAVLDEGVEHADRALIQLESGTLNQFSIGFQYIWDKMEYDENLDAFIIKEVNLFEGSVVTLGANEYTYYAGMKGVVIEEAHRKIREETEALIKSLPAEYQYQTRQLIAKHIALSESQPVKPLKDNEPPAAKSIDWNKVANTIIK